eukprot:6175795-Pleurochrysis_carterae.AAC.1
MGHPSDVVGTAVSLTYNVIDLRAELAEFDKAIQRVDKSAAAKVAASAQHRRYERQEVSDAGKRISLQALPVSPPARCLLARATARRNRQELPMASKLIIESKDECVVGSVRFVCKHAGSRLPNKLLHVKARAAAQIALRIIGVVGPRFQLEHRAGFGN